MDGLHDFRPIQHHQDVLKKEIHFNSNLSLYRKRTNHSVEDSKRKRMKMSPVDVAVSMKSGGKTYKNKTKKYKKYI